jgi:hypothetical protein
VSILAEGVSPSAPPLPAAAAAENWPVPAVTALFEALTAVYQALKHVEALHGGTAPDAAAAAAGVSGAALAPLVSSASAHMQAATAATEAYCSSLAAVPDKILLQQHAKAGGSGGSGGSAAAHVAAVCQCMTAVLSALRATHDAPTSGATTAVAPASAASVALAPSGAGSSAAAAAAADAGGPGKALWLQLRMVESALTSASPPRIKWAADTLTALFSDLQAKQEAATATGTRGGGSAPTAVAAVALLPALAEAQSWLAGGRVVERLLTPGAHESVVAACGSLLASLACSPTPLLSEAHARR